MSKAIDTRYRRARMAYQETSREAWHSIVAVLPHVEQQIVRHIEATYGATCGEVETALGMKHQTASAGIRHLVIGGVLTDSGVRRFNAGRRRCIVWVLPSTPPPEGEAAPATAPEAVPTQPSLFGGD